MKMRVEISLSLYPVRLQVEDGLLTRILTSMGTSIFECGQLLVVFGRPPVGDCLAAATRTFVSRKSMVKRALAVVMGTFGRLYLGAMTTDLAMSRRI